MPWPVFISALALGLLSSFHCVGMCGAIAFSLPTRHLAGFKKLAGILLYNAGRTATYAFLGLVFGIVGRQIHLAGFQQIFSIVAGLTILAVVVQSYIGRPVLHLPGFGRIQLSIQTLIGRFLGSPKLGEIFLLGAANGLLPCGLVYLAITGALATGTIGGAAGFMAAFGLGTIPALFLLSYFGFLINLPVRNFMKKAVPYVVALMGILLVLRGLDLGIPMVSPSFSAQQNSASCH